MVTIKINFVLLLLVLSHFAFSQIKVSGIVMQSDSTKLSYVNIGIKLKNVGTVTDKDGHFQLQFPEQFLNDTLTFSYVGLEELNVPVRLLISSSDNIFVLKPQIMQLLEVIVSGKQLKQKSIGTKSHNPFLSGTAESKDNNDIIEFAKFINVRNKVSRVESVSIYILGVNIDTATFRINFYDVKEGLPDKKIVDKTIIERKGVKRGWLNINLLKENIVVNKDFFVGFEFLPEQKFSRYSLSYGGQLGGSYVVRKSSLGNWGKGAGASLSSYVTVQQ